MPTVPTSTAAEVLWIAALVAAAILVGGVLILWFEGAQAARAARVPGQPLQPG